MRPGNGLWIPAFAGRTDKRKCCHSRVACPPPFAGSGNPWLSGDRTFALQLAEQREMALSGCRTLLYTGSACVTIPHGGARCPSPASSLPAMFVMRESEVHLACAGGGRVAPAGVARFARLIRPRSIAVVGGREAARVVEQCDRMGFDGALWPVHPTRGTVAGRTAFRSVAKLPAAPDAAFVAVNRHATVETVATFARMGTGGAVCYASGFLEANDGGALQRALVEAAAGMPVVGPNCYGLINFLDGVPLWPDEHGGRRLAPDERGVAIVVQSSNIGISLTMQQRGLPVAYLVTAGNQAQIGISGLASALLDDERVSAIGLHVEGFDSVAGFEALARKARDRAVPVVAMKTGRSERARASNLTHTASIAGSDAGADAFLRRLGFARVHGIPELLEALKLLHVHGALGGVRVGAMCCSGGEAAVLSDTIEDTGLEFPDLVPEHAASVRATVHPLVTVANPFDYHTFSWGDEAALAETFTAFARGGFDATLLVLDFPRTDRCDDTDWEVAVDAFDRAVGSAGTRGVIAATLAENLPEERATRMIERGIAPLAGVREAFIAIECAALIGDAWRSPPGAPLVAVRPLSSDPILLDESESKAQLAEFGVAVPPGAVANGADEAVGIAVSLGGPVVVKALGIAHKTEQRAVRLGLRGPAEIRAATCDLLVLGHGVLVERFASEVAVELIVGLHRDPQLGLLLTVGSGGIFVELAADSVTMLLPVDESGIREALSRLRCAPVLAGWRGREPADVDAAVASILAIANFAIAHADRIEELDINPLGVGPRGQGAVALDVLIRTRETRA